MWPHRQVGECRNAFFVIKNNKEDVASPLKVLKLLNNGIRVKEMLATKPG